jgi:hypothetical protein
MEFVLNLFDAPEKTRKSAALRQDVKVNTGYSAAYVIPLYHPPLRYAANQNQNWCSVNFKALRPFVS